MAGCPEFNIAVADNITDTLDRVSTLIIKNGGTFSGDATSGAFSGKTLVGMIHGKYQVHKNNIAIQITNKPMFLPCDQIESAITGYFK